MCCVGSSIGALPACVALHNVAPHIGSPFPCRCEVQGAGVVMVFFCLHAGAPSAAMKLLFQRTPFARFYCSYCLLMDTAGSRRWCDIMNSASWTELLSLRFSLSLFRDDAKFDSLTVFLNA